MRKNYKRSAATVIAALFLGNIIPEINGMQGLQPNPLANEQIAILESGKEIRVNYQDPDSVLNALRMAVEENDIPSARGLLNLFPFYDPEVLEKDIKRIDFGIENNVTVETKRKLRFSKRRNEFDEIIFSAMKRDKKAETLLED
ncbi:MAG: hypothetical protein IJ730_00795 [Alphaproteobacteria bacterium]|nr:hypothetical protein [Alphaproteobacteria bacterium]